MKTFLIKLLVVFLAAVICGIVVGGFFSIFFYSIVDRIVPGRSMEIYTSDTSAKMHLRFWIAFIVGAIIGIIWSYKIVKDLK